MHENQLVAPIVKWVGGKRQIVEQILPYIPPSFSTYFEPFLGGGALLFRLQPPRAVVNDLNEELMNLYRVVYEDVDSLIEDLGQHQNNKEYFYRIRRLDRDPDRFQSLTSIQKASRMIYLNRTCYNGLYRVNKSGQFNAPFGKHQNPNIVNEEALRAVHGYFHTAEITFCCADFEIVVQKATKEDFIYFDPPYDPVSETAFFTDYAKKGFDRREQQRLKLTCDRLNERGVRFLLSNSATDFIKVLYKDYHIEGVQAKRAINSKASRRGLVDEVLVMNY